MRGCRRWWLAAAVAASGWVQAAPAAIPGPAFPSFESTAAVDAFCEQGLQRANSRLRALEKHGTDARWLAGYDDLNALPEDRAGPVYLLSNVHPDKAMREAAEACELRWQDFSSSLGQNETLFKAASQLRERDPINALFAKTLLEEFEDAGVSLPPTERRRAKAINDRITALGQEFDKNIRDANVLLAFKLEELRGVPEAQWRKARRDDQARVLLGIDAPTDVSVMQNAVDARRASACGRPRPARAAPPT